MIYGHMIKRYGKYYAAGEDVPDLEETEPGFSEPQSQPQYTKTDINRMPTADLKAFAKERGVQNAEEMTGAELKKVLIDMLDL